MNHNPQFTIENDCVINLHSGNTKLFTNYTEKIMNENLLHTHSEYLTKDHGGESISFITEMFWNGDDPKNGSAIFLNQKFVLNSFSNSASLNITSEAITPELLRNLANKLDRALVEAEIKAQALHDKVA